MASINSGPRISLISDRNPVLGSPNQTITILCHLCAWKQSKSKTEVKIRRCHPLSINLIQFICPMMTVTVWTEGHLPRPLAKTFATNVDIHMHSCCFVQQIIVRCSAQTSTLPVYLCLPRSISQQFADSCTGRFICFHQQPAWEGTVLMTTRCTHEDSIV